MFDFWVDHSQDATTVCSGVWDSTATHLQPMSEAKTAPQGTEVLIHPNWEGEIGTTGEPPSFLYAMPLDDGSVFLEETCLVARPTLPFSALKRRLERRCAAMGIEIEEVCCTGRNFHCFQGAFGSFPEHSVVT